MANAYRVILLGMYACELYLFYSYTPLLPVLLTLITIWGLVEGDKINGTE